MQLHLTDLSGIRRAISNASQEVLITLSRYNCTSEKQVDLAALRDFLDTDRVRTRVYVPAAEKAGPEQCERRLANLANGGVAVQPTSVHAPRMAIVDRSTLVLARNQVDYADGALIGQGIPFIGMLVSALTDPTGADMDDGGLDARSRSVLRQLTLGATDERCARELGMTLRTYRRRVAHLMDILNAQSRFQAGYLAAKRNWL